MEAPPRDIAGLAAVFATSGAVHLVRPEVFEPMMPQLVPAHREVIYASGVAELVCAAGLLHPRTRVAAGWASFALLLAVYPANLKMAADASRTRRSGRSPRRDWQAATLLRLPLQVPALRAAWRAAHPR